MEFVDYKCLESLLIEGENLIATEGFIDTVKKKVIDFFKMIGRLITKFIGIIKSKFGKGKSSKKFSSDELKKMGIDTFEPEGFEPAKKNPPSDEDAKKVADSIKQRYENSEQYKKHKADSEEAKKPVEDTKSTRGFKDVKIEREFRTNHDRRDISVNREKQSTTKRKSCASKIYDLILKIRDVEKSMFLITLDLYKLEMQSTEYDMSPLHNKFDAIKDKIDTIEEIYNSINNTEDYYLDINGIDTKENIIGGLYQIKADIDKHIARFEKEDKAIKSVYKENEKMYNMYTPMMKNCSKITTLISNIMNLVNKLDINP